jgi:hypothetical protein
LPSLHARAVWDIDPPPATGIQVEFDGQQEAQQLYAKRMGFNEAYSIFNGPFPSFYPNKRYSLNVVNFQLNYVILIPVREAGAPNGLACWARFATSMTTTPPVLHSGFNLSDTRHIPCGSKNRSGWKG